MESKTITCDRCGAPIERDRTRLRALCGPLRTRPDVDLCNDCRTAFEAWLATRAGGRLTDPAAGVS
jgi:hypothetical protein